MRLDDVWLRYHRRGRWVLRAVGAELGPGEVAVVLGRNGVGKSTLLQLAAGVLRPTRGRVVDRPGVVGWVPERFPADQAFAVAPYLTAMARVAGLSATGAERAAAHWIERLGLSGFRQVRLPQLSKGTAQKVGLAQAMLRPPGLLVLDEPWEGLDAAARELVPELIDEVLTAGGAVLVSDHRGETVRLPGARRWTVADGTLSAEEPPAGESAMAVVELAVPAARVVGTVARLRADGHQILRVRDPANPLSGRTPAGIRPDSGLADPGRPPLVDSGTASAGPGAAAVGHGTAPAGTGAAPAAHEPVTPSTMPGPGGARRAGGASGVPGAAGADNAGGSVRVDEPGVEGPAREAAR